MRVDAHGVADAGERGLDEPGVTAEQHRGAHLAAERVGERREILALAVAAGDHHQRPGKTADGRQRRADVRALRIVDVAHAPDVRDPLRAMRQAGEIAQLLEHRRERQTQRVAERQRRERVGGVVAAGDLERGQRQQRRAAAREPRLLSAGGVISEKSAASGQC